MKSERSWKGRRSWGVEGRWKDVGFSLGAAGATSVLSRAVMRSTYTERAPLDCRVENLYRGEGGSEEAPVTAVAPDDGGSSQAGRADRSDFLLNVF